MPAPDPRLERRGLYASIVITTVLGVVGVVWGWAVGSQMILFDGVFAFVGVVVSLVLVGASALSSARPTPDYPYGRAGATPLAIGIQGFVLFATLVYAAVEAVLVIRIGGSDFAPGWAILYGVLTTASGIAVWLWLRASAGASDLLASEATAWKVSALRGVFMVVGFSVMWLLLDSRWDGAAPYVDPVMVLLSCGAFLPAPVRLIRGTVLEMLEAAPRAEIEAPVLAVVREVLAQYPLGEPVVRVTKVGPKLYVEVESQAAPDLTIAAEHEVRLAIESGLHDLPYEIWLNVELLPVAPSA